MNIDNVKEGCDLIQKGMGKLSHGPLDYYLRTLVGCYEFLLTLAPYQPGDRVRLTRTPEISNRERWGWMRAKHFMKAGAIARIATVSADGDGFRYGLQFEEDSWMDSTMEIHPSPENDRAVYGLTADWFERCSAPQHKPEHAK